MTNIVRSEMFRPDTINDTDRPGGWEVARHGRLSPGAFLGAA